MTLTGQTTKSSTLWAPDRRAATTGLLLLVTLAAFENMGVSTALPTLVADLNGHELYSWPFTAFLAAQVVGTVIGGRACDLRGPKSALLVGPLLFLVGLLVAGSAHDMGLLLAGRVLQGLGGGVQVVALYVLIALVFPEPDRPVAFAALSAAWVVPSLIGPTIAGLLTQYLSWRWVFLGLAPLVLLGWLLLFPVLRRLPAQHSTSLALGAAPRAAPVPDGSLAGSLTKSAHESAQAAVRRGLPLAALAAAVGLAALTWAGEHPSGLALGLGVLGLLVLAPSLRLLLPKGTLLARPGLPTVILSRSLLAGTFFGVQAYLPLTLSQVHGLDPALAGLPLTIGSLGWSGAAMWQGRHRELSRTTLVRHGFVLLAAGLALVTLVAPSWGSPWLALPAWVFAGIGMGLGISSVAVLVLELSEPGDRGFNSAALQLSDMIGQSVFIGLGGVLVAALGSATSPTAAVIPLDLGMAALALLGALLVRRSARNS
ncbi:MFS transporter [Kutzneria viridogrisea]|uniref:MFS family permease n=1 Tax=Kutzneria viridogrisea TaxID=47990 RepID=A0ABR6BH55_9PSEU|nr:MFS family permease [Kutzneria viridogrisea]